MAETDPLFNDAEFGVQELKNRNRGLYLCSLYFPEDKQDAARAVFSLFLELKKIPETISEPILGQIRTTWWRELIEREDFESAGSPLGREIIKAITTHSLNKSVFYELLVGVTEDLYIQHYADDEALAAFYDKTFGAVFSILSNLLGAKNIDKVLRRASSQALGIALSLYETPISLQRAHHYFPLTRLKAHQINPDELRAHQYEQTTAAMITELENRALQQLEAANEALAKAENDIKPAFLPLCQVRPLLKEVNKNTNPLAQINPVSALSLQWHLWRSARKGRF